MTAKTTAERQQALRAKRAALGLTEVRGIWAPPEDHAAIKASVKRAQGRKKGSK
jgi:hypothetical protein